MSVRRNLLHRAGALGLMALIGTVAVGCSRDGETSATTSITSAPTTSTPVSTTTSTVPASATFGDMSSPCGPASGAQGPTIAEGQNGADTLRLGLANDHGFAGADEPTREMLDAAQAFASWCNSQGGVRGLPIEIVDLDAAGTGVALAMERACAETFALVGGGWTFDDQMFPRFHECGLISIPGYTASAAASMGNGKVQPIPSPIDRDSSAWLQWIADTYRDAVDNVAIVHADLVTTRALAQRLSAFMKIVDGFGDPISISYEPSDTVDWSDIVRQLVNDKVTAVSFIGDASHLIDFQTAMTAANYTPDVIFGDSNLMSSVISEAAQVNSFANLRLRSIHAPLSEADSFPAIASYLDMMSEYSPDGRAGGLGLNTTSAMLLFVTAANACLESNGNVLERECTLARAKEITDWTAGGLHAAMRPGENSPSPCLVVVGLEGGSWTRIFPLRGSEDDNTKGWFCNVDSIVSIEGDFGDVSIGVDPSRLN